MPVIFLFFFEPDFSARFYPFERAGASLVTFGGHENGERKLVRLDPTPNCDLEVTQV